jgi:2-methylcitrate dehydratase PrpD
LAEAGHTGPRNILDSALYYRFADGLSFGAAQHICNGYFKLYACCRHVHAPVDALLGLIQQHQIDASSIDAIEVETYGGALRISNTADPAHLVDVQYSIPYCLALAAMAGPRVLLPLTAEALEHVEARTLARRVTVSLDPSLDARFPAQTLARVTVTRGAERFVSEVTAPRGDSTHPLSWEELEAKFRAATRRVATEAQQNRVLSSVNEASARDLSDLTAFLSEPLQP